MLKRRMEVHSGGYIMKRMFTLSLIALAGSCWMASLRADPASRQVTQESMRRKLDFARGVLEGLTLDRLELVVTNAQALRDLTQTNAYTITGNPNYRAATTNFSRHVDRLIDSAKAGNLQRATEAYHDVTRGCIGCHKTFRPEQFRKAQAEAAKP